MDNPFGVLEFLHWNHAWNNYKYPSAKEIKKTAALIRKSGAGWVRMDFLWEDIEPKEGSFNFSKYDLIVDALYKNNLHLLGILNYSAPWAAKGRKWNSPPKDNQLFVNYAVKVIEHYKDKIKHWEVWNEPDSATYWFEQDGLKKYCALLKEVYLAAKKIDPDCKILNGGISGGFSNVNKLYDNGAKDYFDILNLHIFEAPLRRNSINAVTAYLKLAYKIMARNGDSQKKIWITEIGCPGVGSSAKTKNWWLGENPTEEQQAEWVGEIYGGLLKNKNVEKVFWAYFRDCKDHWKNGIDYFGLVRWDFSAKPAFRSYLKACKAWEKPKR